MNGNIRVSENNKFNKDFTEILQKYFGREISSQRFKEINFAYLFNLPLIISNRNGELKIRINEDIENYRWDRDFVKNISERKNKVIMQLKQLRYNVESFSLTVFWRLVIGLGASHPQETSMTLHHIYGIPYIPASAVKGVARHWAILKFADEKSKKENQGFEKSVKEVSDALDKCNDLNFEVDGITFNNLIRIFGTQKQEGKVMFFDAYPLENINLKIDIMNPHYPEYYSGKLPPADWQSPVPIKFLTIERTKFQFHIASKEKDLLDKVRKLLIEVLKNYGIGAKTSLGYGQLT